ncbi:MAG: hypothetical protein GY861_01415, partial [bacterium]|nr:hypothetical protein [bacterium]
MAKLNNDSQETRGDGGTSTNTNVSGTFEWAKYTVNFIDGCKHDCKYCYAK